MFVFKPILLFLAVSLPFGSAAPADNAVPVARAFSHDELANITGRGVTTNPAVEFDIYGTTSCGDYLGYERAADATCIPLPWEAIDILQFYGNCRFMRVFSSDGCTGSDYADLGNTGECWQVALRYSFQVYC